MKRDPSNGAAMEGVLIHGLAWMEGRTGYNVFSCGFFEALSRRLTTVVSPLLLRDGPVPADRRMLAELFAPRQAVSIAMLYPTIAAEMLEGAPPPRIIHTVWESTRIPDPWHEPLLAADQIWVPSTWVEEVFRGNGIPAERLRIVPGGVDPSVFNPGATPAAAINGKGGFRFLNVGRWERRKGTRDLIQAFDAEFGAEDDAMLVVSCDNPFDPSFDLGATLRSMNLRAPEKLIFVPPIRRHAHLADLYVACDAFVIPTRAEGWGFPIVEAMACGLPVIVTDHSAPRDYLGEEAYRIGCRMVAIDEPFFEVADRDFGQWAEPDIGHMRALMREVFENRAEARDRGMAGGDRIRRDLTWDASAAAAVSILRESLFPSSD